MINESNAKRDISIHAPHTRSDPAAIKRTDDEYKISIHAPHTRSDRHTFTPSFF